MTHAALKDLLPCPFCGGEAAATNYVVEAAVRCGGCGATVMRQHPPMNDEGLPAAIAAWNRRAALSAMEGEAVAWRDDIKTLIDNGQVWHDASQDEACAYVAARDRLMKASGYGDTAPPPQQAVGEVVVTTDETVRCVMVSRQDDEHRILNVLWEAPAHPTPSPGPQGGGECETCDGLGYVVRYHDPYKRGDVSSPEDVRCPDCATPPAHQPGEVGEDAVERVARAIAAEGFGRPWDDFLPLSAEDTDQGDLIEYAQAAIRALAPKEDGHG